MKGTRPAQCQSTTLYINIHKRKVNFYYFLSITLFKNRYSCPMNKDFDSWNEIKKDINKRETSSFYYPKEIWWCSLGLNVGSEEDGKNELYERPVLILKAFNRKMVRVVPLTSSGKEDKNRVSVLFLGIQSFAKLSQLKTISTQRLSRSLCVLDQYQFNKVIEALKKQLI